MSTKPLMLDGLVDTKKVDREGLLHQWRREKERLEQDIRVLRSQLENAKAENEKLSRSIQALRRQLSPLHHALRAVFGEIELAIGSETAAPADEPVAFSAPAANNSRWEAFKQTFPGAPARIIDALLAHREMTISQLMTVLKAHYDTVQKALSVLTKAGAIVKEGSKGGKYRLAS